MGAGNSAGQAVVFLSPYVKRLTMLVRGKGLEASMSRYLIDRIKSLDNVNIQVRSELLELLGDRTGALEGATVRNNASGEVSRIPARQVFMFVGAEPNTGWLEGCLSLDDKGYISDGPESDRRANPYPTPSADEPVTRIRDRRRPLRLDEASRLRGRRGRRRRRTDSFDAGRLGDYGLTGSVGVDDAGVCCAANRNASRNFSWM